MNIYIAIHENCSFLFRLFVQVVISLQTLSQNEHAPLSELVPLHITVATSTTVIDHKSDQAANQSTKQHKKHKLCAHEYENNSLSLMVK